MPTCQAHHQFITRPSLPCLGVFVWLLYLDPACAGLSVWFPPHPLPVSQLPWFHLSNPSGAFWSTFLTWHIPCSTSGAPHCSRTKPRSLCSGPWGSGHPCPSVSSPPADVGNLISGSSAFSKSSLKIWKFTVHVLLKPRVENFEHYFASV